MKIGKQSSPLCLTTEFFHPAGIRFADVFPGCPGGGLRIHQTRRDSWLLGADCQQNL